MIETGLPDDLLKDLTDEISQLIKNSNYDNYDLAEQFPHEIQLASPAGRDW